MGDQEGNQASSKLCRWANCAAVLYFCSHPASPAACEAVRLFRAMLCEACTAAVCHVLLTHAQSRTRTSKGKQAKTCANTSEGSLLHPSETCTVCARHSMCFVIIRTASLNSESSRMDADTNEHR
jgi:N-methylhydantoinase B/oxoprolinase/acetone carboxylase alpha subunit